jgi:hypothetical protein
MDIVKKNILSIVCGAVAILAIAASFYPLSGWFVELNEQAEQRKRPYSEAMGLLNKTRDWPVLDPDRRERERMTKFPSADVIKWGQVNIVALKTQANEIARVVLAINDHSKRPGLLADGVLPSPAPLAPSDFRDRYHEEMKFFYFGTPKEGQQPDPGKMIQRLGGTLPPAEQDIKTAVEQNGKEWDAKQQIVGGQVINGAEILAGKARDAIRIPEDMRRKRAENGMMYLPPNGGLNYYMKIYEAKTTREPPAVYDIWWAQVGYWIQSDLADAIITTNKKAGSTNVTNSVVKHLVDIQIPPAFRFATGDRSSATGGAPPPAAAPGMGMAAQDQPISDAVRFG